MRPSLEQLETFAAAAREQSFSATARKLGKSQSAVSTAIAELEIDLGVELFDRAARYPVLTHAGTALLAQVDGILSHCDALVDRASALAGTGETHLAIVMEEPAPTTPSRQSWRVLPTNFRPCRSTSCSRWAHRSWRWFWPAMPCWAWAARSQTTRQASAFADWER